MLYAILCSYENSCRLNACSSKLVLRPSCSNNLLQVLAAELASLRARLLQLDKGPYYTVRTHIPDYFLLRIDFHSDGKIVSVCLHYTASLCIHAPLQKQILQNTKYKKKCVTSHTSRLLTSTSSYTLYEEVISVKRNISKRYV